MNEDKSKTDVKAVLTVLIFAVVLGAIYCPRNSRSNTTGTTCTEIQYGREHTHVMSKDTEMLALIENALENPDREKR